MSEAFVAGPLVRDDDEGLFSRDFGGQLVRLDSPTASDYDRTVTLQIDGQAVTVPMAAPMKDADGNIVQDTGGRTTPRYTTIYDAAARLYVRQVGDEAKIPIPTLCHLEHMKPTAVCRLCSVQIYGQKRGKRAAERRLLPACQHQVKEGMEVFTMNDAGPDGARVRQSVRVITELLATDHLKSTQSTALEKEFAPFNELAKMVGRTGAVADRLRTDVLSDPPPARAPLAARRGVDDSSPVFQVDHDACILCDRCIRACDDVRENHVIGRTGKGVTAGISFDLDDPMGDSSCVQCGECMISCPTDAILFKPGARVKISARDYSKNILSASELTSDPLFAGISPKFLLWQRGLVVRRTLRKGEIVCRQGEAGNTAFLLKSGTVQVSVDSRKNTVANLSYRSSSGHQTKVLAKIERTADPVIIGEMACMTGTARNATVTAVTRGEVWEIRRNVLDRLMRVPSLKQFFEGSYRERVMGLILRNAELFRQLDRGTFERVVEYLRPKISFVRVRAGQAVFNQGDVAEAVYFVRLGHVRTETRTYGGNTRSLTRGPGAILGEIGLLSLSARDVHRTLDEVDAAVAHTLKLAGENLGNAVGAEVRANTCSALGNLELARLNREDFLEMIREFPGLRRRLVELSLERLRGERVSVAMLDEYIDQGLYEARSVLVLDLDRCTRCDLCTRGCIEEHGHDSHGMGVSRLLREGVRFGNFTVATSCRSCTDAHCMVGCPVDSIHRGKHQQIVIEDHCIGCGLCATNCPYGSIFMLPNQRKSVEVRVPGHPGQARSIGQPKAAVCDLCDAHGDRTKPQPQCVSSCPHDAAFRLTGPELLERATARR